MVRLHVVMMAFAYVCCDLACQAQEPPENRQYLLTIDVVHRSTRDAVKQDIMVSEGNSFFVRTQDEDLYWTFSGHVGGVVHGHLPVLLRTRYQHGESLSDVESARLLKINGKSTPRGGPIGGPANSLAVRELNETDLLPFSDVMADELQRKICELRETQIPEEKDGKARRCP